MNYISASKARHKLALTELHTAKRNSKEKTDSHPHLVIIGPLGASKEPIADAITTRFPDIYEKARSLRNCRHHTATDSRNHIYAKFLGAHPLTIFWKRFVDSVKDHWYFLIDKPRVNMRGSMLPITESIFTIGSTTYAIDCNELQKIIAKGKKTVSVTSVKGALALQKVLGNVHIVNIQASREKCFENLTARYQAYRDYKHRLPAAMEFSDEENARLKRSGLVYETRELKNQVYNLAEDMVYAAETKKAEVLA